MARPGFSTKTGGMQPDPKINLGAVLSGVIVSYILSIILFLILGILMALTRIPETSLPTVVVVLSVISIGFGGAFTAKKARTAGWVNGGLTGAVYVAVILVMGMLFVPHFALTGNVLLRIVVGFGVGMIGGIFGVNL